MRGDDFIVELWAKIKHYISPKDRLEAADALVAAADEYGFVEGLELHEDLDKELHAAVKTHYKSFDDFEDEGYGDW